ncbi:MAG: competence/damage-inducible protein A [Candidatus Rokuibacteriota bacterium]|nr:MAG: competence/damage-inducible protein A [Candidatus Rokubacteria bacterium]
MTVRAGFVITGTEVLAGRVRDRNGPWLADRLAELGVELAHVLITGDRPADLMSALGFMRAEGADLVVTSGGLGPTADDMTAEVVANFAERPLQLDEALEERIGRIIARFARRWRIDAEALRIANRKQAMVPEGAIALDPVGTAPGLVVPAGEQLVVVLPGPPRELQESWAQAVETEPFKALAARAPRYRQTMLRLFGIPESEIAETLRVAEQEVGLDGLEITTCLRRGELEVVVRSDTDSNSASEALTALIEERHRDALFSVDGSSIEEQVARLLDDRRVAVGESCTGGLLCTRLSDRPGSSKHFAGGVVAYSDEAKVELLGVDATLIARHGAVSEEVAEALAAGAIDRFQADFGIGVTGIAGPDGGTPEKPVGRVCFGIVERDGARVVRALDLPGSRAEVRDRSTTVALHLLRRMLAGQPAPV